MRPQLRGVSAKSTEKLYQEQLQYEEHLLFTVATFIFLITADGDSGIVKFNVSFSQPTRFKLNRATFGKQDSG